VRCVPGFHLPAPLTRCLVALVVSGSQRLQQTGAYRDFSIDLRPTEGIDPLKGGDLHVSLDEARIAANTGVTRSTSGTVEWMGEVSLANTLGYAETITAKVSQSKNDFSVTEVRGVGR
jgi:hypothetical protein